MLRFSRTGPLLVVVALMGLCRDAAGETPAESWSLTSNRATGSIDQIDASLEVAGEIQYFEEGTRLGSAQLAVLANLRYDERSLMVPESASAPTRSVRHYDRALAAIQIDRQESHLTLRDDRRLIAVDVAEGKATLFCPTAPLGHDELDLIDLQANTLVLDRLLPAHRVAIGQTWEHSDELMGVMLGLDAVSRNDARSVAASVQDSIATLEISGEVHGAIHGVATEIELRGKYQFDLVRKRITWFGLLVQEKRSVGHVGPGLEVVGRLQMKITPLERSPQLADGALAGLSLEPSESNTWLSYQSVQGGWQLLNERRWFVTRDEPETAVLRLIDRGDFIAQCNISSVPQAVSGKLPTLSQFQKEVQQGLGSGFGQFLSARQYVSDLGHRVFRVVVDGSASEVPIQWTYYLLAEPSGRQLVMVFIVEGVLVERMVGADEQLVGSVQFLEEMTASGKTSPRR